MFVKIEKNAIITVANDTIPNSAGDINLARIAETISATIVEEYFSTADQKIPFTNTDFVDIYYQHSLYY